MIRTTHTLGCFQIESPGQRELIGKFAPETFGDLIVDISLFRPGPVKSDMVTPLLRVRQGWASVDLIHPDLEPVIAETNGVVVFHEQVIAMIATISGCSLAQGDEIRRTMGSPEGQAEVRAWFYPQALGRGYSLEVVERVWDVLRAFASFGFCKAHAAAFALPTYQSAWLKAHHPAAFLAGVLTHDPGMYPKRLILDDARNLGISILGVDVNRSATVYRVEDCPTPAARPTLPGLPDGSAHGIRLPLTEVKGIAAAEVERIVAGQPYASLTDFWQRANVAIPVVENLVLTGGFDSLYGIDLSAGARVRGQVTRRDLLLEVADCDRLSRSARAGSSRGRRAPRRSDTRTDPRAERAASVWGPGRAGGAGSEGPPVPPTRPRPRQRSPRPPRWSDPARCSCPSSSRWARPAGAAGCPRCPRGRVCGPSWMSSGWTSATTFWTSTGRCWPISPSFQPVTCWPSAPRARSGSRA